MNKRGAPREEQQDSRALADIVARVEPLDADGLRREIGLLEERWLGDASDFGGMAVRAFECFGLDPHDTLDTNDVLGYGLRRIDDVIHEHEMTVLAVVHRAQALNVDQSVALRCLEQLYYAKRVVLSAFQGKLALANGEIPEETLDLDPELDARLGSWSLRFRWMDDEITCYQRLLLFMLDRAVERGYRRHEDSVYEPMVIDGFTSHAWRRVSDITTWVHESCRKELNLEQWKWMTQGKNAKMCIEHLKECQDHSFPVLQKCRNAFAFRNGLYMAKTDEWHPLGRSRVGPDVVAAKFWDVDLPEEVVDLDYTDIPTPLLDSIMDYQNFSREVKHWLYITLGRLLYEVNEVDNWQIIPFFKGQAGSGKSTLVLHVAKRFFEDIDVGVLSNNVERKFGLSAFAHKLLFVAPEVKSDLVLEQAEFQSMVSGEDITVNTKFQTAYSKVWTAPGVLAGNEVPGWMDNAGSLQRRFLLFDFHRTVDKADSRLGQKLAAEVPRILVKCNKAYLDAVRRWGDVNVWTILPEYFKDTRNSLAQMTNAVEGFIATGAVEFGEDKYCPFEDFKIAMQAFMQQNNYKKIKLNWDVFRGPLESRNVTKKRETLDYHGRRMTKDFLRGVDLAATEEMVI